MSMIPHSLVQNIFFMLLLLLFLLSITILITIDSKVLNNRVLCQRHLFHSYSKFFSYFYNIINSIIY